MQTPYGSPDGIADRLRDWGERLGKDHRIPFVGLGLFRDLETAANMLEGKAPPPPMEFDL